MSNNNHLTKQIRVLRAKGLWAHMMLHHVHCLAFDQTTCRAYRAKGWSRVELLRAAQDIAASGAAELAHEDGTLTLFLIKDESLCPVW